MSVLSTGTSALLSYQRALSTTSENVANLGTKGYSRQKTTLTALDTGGVSAGISRSADELVNARLLDSTGELARLDNINTLSSRVDKLFSDKTTNLSGSWSDFFDSINALSSDPSSSSSRQSVLDHADALATRLNQMDNQLDAIDSDINATLKAGTDEVNQTATKVAELNRQIAHNANASSTLLDQRDQLVSKLVGYTGGYSKRLDDGSVNVYSPGGQGLVVGATSARLTTVADPYQADRLQLAFVDSKNTTTVADAHSIGGSLGGALEFRSTTLDTTLADLGQIATAAASALNSAQKSGADLYGNLGSDLFNIADPSVSANSANTGNATLQATIGDLSKLDASNVVLSYDGKNWSARSATSGAALVTTGSGTAADPLVVNGVRIVIGGTPAKGDRFLLRPTAGAAGTLSLAFTDTGKLAAAKPIQATAATSNVSKATVAGLTVDAADNPALRTSVNLQFDGKGNYSTDGGGSWNAYSDNRISLNGWTLSLNGTPAAGDRFTIAATGANSSDNDNLLQMAKLEQSNLLDNGTVSLNGAIANLTTTAGSAARQAQSDYDAQNTLQTDAQSAHDSVSGVNADEEAANLIFYQQAYQAAAQVISSANTTFQTLLEAVK